MIDRLAKVPYETRLQVTAFAALSLFAFNLVQLFMFKQFDFVTMYSFRLLYYTYWHIIWGYARLQVLF